MKKQYFTIPNCITVLRIIGTFVLLFITPLTAAFFVIYTLTGVTDVLDGFIARKCGLSSEFGARLDSISDLLFYTVMLIKILPIMIAKLPAEIWYAVGVILILRIASYITAAIKYKRFASLHTYMNKLTGAAVFTVPYVICLPFAAAICFVYCGIAAIASAEELMIHLQRDTYRSNTKSIVFRGE